MDIDAYNRIRSGGTGFIEMPRGLIAVWGREAVPFLDGLITNSVKKMLNGDQMLAAFSDAKGRLIGVVRVLRREDRYLFETEQATRDNVFQNLHRFTLAGDFFVEDLSEQYRYFEIFGELQGEPTGAFYRFQPMRRISGRSDVFISGDEADHFREKLAALDGILIDDQLYETLRIESGIPKYGVDMDEATIVPELGIEEMISYNKGCYIGQEIIARIHFRGHVAKQLTGFMSEPGAVATALTPGMELTSSDGKNAGRVTSVAYSPKLGRQIALGYVRYDYRLDEAELTAGDGNALVNRLPFDLSIHNSAPK